MLTSCGIQWLAQVERYFSQAHLYLNGTSWLTSVWPLMMRLSAMFTRRALTAAAMAESTAETAGFGAAGGTGKVAASGKGLLGSATGATAGFGTEWIAAFSAGAAADGSALIGVASGCFLTSSSQTSMGSSSCDVELSECCSRTPSTG
jgi:hypothetical protein